MADSVASKFQGLPIEELIAAPLKAASDSQQQLATSALEFMTKIGFDGPDSKDTRLIKFDLERPIEGTGDTSKVTVNAPFLGLVPIPALLIEDVNIEFQMEVTDATTAKSKTEVENTWNFSGKYNGLFAKASVNVAGKVTTSRENTRSTNQTAKYQVNVAAKQQRPTEGMSRLMDILAASIEPLPAGQ